MTIGSLWFPIVPFLASLLQRRLVKLPSCRSIGAGLAASPHSCATDGSSNAGAETLASCTGWSLLVGFGSRVHRSIALAPIETHSRSLVFGGNLLRPTREFFTSFAQTRIRARFAQAQNQTDSAINKDAPMV